jgi:hypothetical protein
MSDTTFNPPEEQIKHNVSILSNTKETTFCSRFEINTKQKDVPDSSEQKWFYTEHYKESESTPGIPASIPSSFSLANVHGESIFIDINNQEHRDLLLAIQKAVIDYETVTEEDLKEGVSKIEAELETSINVE